MRPTPAFFGLLLAAALSSFLPACHAANPAQQPEPLQATVSGFVARPEFAAASWGIRVVDANHGSELFATNAHKLLKPASNAKLFTAALALDLFGPDHRLRTDLIPQGAVRPDGTLRGDLIVFGRGDFSFASRFARTEAPGGSPFAPLVNALIRAGIRRVDGALVADDSFFQGDPFGTGWTWDDTRYAYGAKVSALTSGDNLNPEGTQPVPDPALHFVGGLRRELEAVGIPVKRGFSRRSTAGCCSTLLRQGAPPIGVESPPMSELVRQMLKPSQNLYAQLLLLQAGTTVQPLEAGESSESRGLRAMAQLLARAGIAGHEVRLDDGSGLSRSSLATPHSLVEILRFMDRHPSRDAFLEALPVAGVDGTLRTRFGGANDAARGNLRAKTGSFRYVNALSGFVTNASGHRLVFSALLNAYDPPTGGPSGRDAVEAVAGILARSRE